MHKYNVLLTKGRLREHYALLVRRSVKERTVRLDDWDAELTAKFYTLAASARSRRSAPDSSQLLPAALNAMAADFLSAARHASSYAKAPDEVLQDVSKLLKVNADPKTEAADDVAARFRFLCAGHSLECAYVVARCTPLLARVNRAEVEDCNERACEFFAHAARASEV